jgi:hypothetical protein
MVGTAAESITDSPFQPGGTGALGERHAEKNYLDAARFEAEGSQAPGQAKLHLIPGLRIASG